MESFLVKILIAIFVMDLALVAWRVTDAPNGREVLSLVSFSQSTPSPKITPTPLPTKIPTPSQEPTIIPVPTSLPTPLPTAVTFPKFSQAEIHGFIDRFSVQYGVDPNVLRHIAVCESGFNAAAVNGHYAGLYQFGETAWKSNRALMGESADPLLRFDAEESIQTAAFVVSKGIKNIWPNCYP